MRLVLISRWLGHDRISSKEAGNGYHLECEVAVL
jgi:hypothetical protein